MRRIVFDVAAAVAAGAIVLLVAAVSGLAHGALRWLIVSIVAVGAIGLAWLATRHFAPAPRTGTRIGNRIRSKQDTIIEDVSVGPAQADVGIGNDIRSKRSTRLRGITVGRIRKPKQ